MKLSVDYCTLCITINEQQSSMSVIATAANQAIKQLLLSYPTTEKQNCERVYARIVIVLS